MQGFKGREASLLRKIGKSKIKDLTETAKILQGEGGAIRRVPSKERIAGTPRRVLCEEG